MTYWRKLLALLGLPIFTGIAIVRYRFYDIDLIINRTLVYGALAGMLALVYFGGVATAQAIFRTLTGQEQQSQLAVVISTLVIAALFTPCVTASKASSTGASTEVNTMPEIP